MPLIIFQTIFYYELSEQAGLLSEENKNFLTQYKKELDSEFSSELETKAFRKYKDVFIAKTLCLDLTKRVFSSRGFVIFNDKSKEHTRAFGLDASIFPRRNFLLKIKGPTGEAYRFRVSFKGDKEAEIYLVNIVNKRVRNV